MNITREIAGLRHMTPGELRIRYAEMFGEPSLSGNKDHLVKRIAWRLQALAEGDLSERAHKRASELARDTDLRLRPPPGRSHNGRGQVVTVPLERRSNADERLPPPGSVISRHYKGRDIRVTVLESGFEHDGEVYRSLSAVAKAITGTHTNGYHFFRLSGESKS